MLEKYPSREFCKNEQDQKCPFFSASYDAIKKEVCNCAIQMGVKIGSVPPNAKQDCPEIVAKIEGRSIKRNKDSVKNTLLFDPSKIIDSSR